MSNATDTKFAAIWAEALAAGNAAGAAAAPTPMVLNQHTNPLDDASPVAKSYFVADGVCGFGWVHMKGTSGFARWAFNTGIARRDYPTGLAISSKLMTQSLTRNEAWAHAVAAVLTEKGIPATGRSRID